MRVHDDHLAILVTLQLGYCVTAPLKLVGCFFFFTGSVGLFLPVYSLSALSLSVSTEDEMLKTINLDVSVLQS